MYRRILVPVSHGAASEQGVIEGLRLARAANASLCFIHVSDEPRDGDGHAGFSGTIDEFLALPAPVAGCGAALVEGARRQAEAAGLACEAVLRHGADVAASELVVREARSWRAEIIVMGAAAVRGAGLRPGSVGARIMHASPVPVMAISPRGGGACFTLALRMGA